jgi:hypothetical protein
MEVVGVIFLSQKILLREGKKTQTRFSKKKQPEGCFKFSVQLKPQLMISNSFARRRKW